MICLSAAAPYISGFALGLNLFLLGAIWRWRRALAAQRREAAAYNRAAAQLEMLRVALWLIARRVNDVVVIENDIEIEMRITAYRPG